MSVYAPSGSGNVHVDRIMGTGGKKVAKAKKGMGFQAAASSAAKSAGVSKQQGAAMVAAASRKASPAAKKANPNLSKVAMPKKGRAAKGGKGK
jgi:4-hydroxyphenylpyruvate dioxygenase-like putative hemolysin